MRKMIACVGLLVLSSLAQATIVLNKDYIVLGQSHAVQSTKKIEVLEFFSYHCTHCFYLSEELDKAAQQWSQSVELKRIQVMWGEPFLGFTRLLATIEVMGKAHVLQHRVFAAFLEKGIMLYEPAILEGWIKSQSDINFNQFMQHYRSLPVSYLMTYYTIKTKEYDIRVTPVIIVNGKYKVLPASPERMVEVIRELVAKVKQERKK